MNDTNKCLVYQPTQTVSVFDSKSKVWAAYNEIISEGNSGSNGALVGTRRAVHLGGASLMDAMPMKTGRLVPKAVVYLDDQTVAHGDIYLWTRELAVDANHSPRVPIWSRSSPRNVPIVVNDLSKG